MTDIVKLRVLELYSGIGGMHCALQGSINLTIVIYTGVWKY